MSGDVLRVYGVNSAHVGVCVFAFGQRVYPASFSAASICSSALDAHTNMVESGVGCSARSMAAARMTAAMMISPMFILAGEGLEDSDTMLGEGRSGHRSTDKPEQIGCRQRLEADLSCFS